MQPSAGPLLPSKREAFKARSPRWRRVQLGCGFARGVGALPSADRDFLPAIDEPATTTSCLSRSLGRSVCRAPAAFSPSTSFPPSTAIAQAQNDGETQ
jgi:hypothetical protein